MSRKPYQIKHPVQLRGLLGVPGFRTGGVGQIKLDAPDLPAELISDWEKALNKSYHACGCGEAAIGLLLGVIGFAVWYITPAVRSDLWIGLAAIVGGLVIGKLFGLTKAQLRLRTLSRQITAAWRAPVIRQDNPIICG